MPLDLPQVTEPSYREVRAGRGGVRTWLVCGLLVGASALRPAAFADEIAAGRTYFMRYCASCHGVDADGHGYVAPALAHPPGDLRRLGEGKDTAILAERLVRSIDGRTVVTAHGERDMPVWGERFADIKRAEGAPREQAVRDRINAIVAYLLSIQVPARPHSPQS
jgi:mono/diheme cytochrome c family protein